MVKKGKIKELIKAALLSPSSKNKNILNELSKCKEDGANFLSGAPLALVVIADEGKSNVWVEDISVISTIIQITAESLGLGSCWVQIRNRIKNSEESAEQYVKNF